MDMGMLARLWPGSLMLRLKESLRESLLCLRGGGSPSILADCAHELVAGVCTVLSCCCCCWLSARRAARTGMTTVLWPALPTLY